MLHKLDAISDEKYGSKIVSTVSRQSTERYGGTGGSSSLRECGVAMTSLS